MSHLLDAAPYFEGPTYSAEHDQARLMGQHERVRALMIDGHWRTLGEIEALTGAPAASASAQLRHLRKARFGGYQVERRARGDRSSGLFEYRCLAASGAVTPKRQRLSDLVKELRAENEKLRAQLAAVGVGK